jgi:hypothetical protein
MDAVDVIDNTPTTYTFNRVYLSIGMTQAKTTLSNVGIEIIPEPASVGLVLLGGKL